MARDNTELALALRQWRDRLSPAAVGLPPGGTRRRAVGLRREELAWLAGVSVDYVVRLEQRRGPQPSSSVLTAIARALRLSPAETEHLFTLADVPPPAPRTISDTVRPSVQALLDRMRDLPAMLVNLRGDVLAWNDLVVAVIGDFSAVPVELRTHLWLHFAEDDRFRSRLVVDEFSGPRLDRSTVAEARAALARFPDDERLLGIVTALRSSVPRFAALWDERPIEFRWSDVKTYLVPEVGPLTLSCESLLVPGDEQTLVVYSAEPGSVDAEKLDRLRARREERANGQVH